MVPGVFYKTRRDTVEVNDLFPGGVVSFGGGGKGGPDTGGDNGERPGNQGLFRLYQRHPGGHFCALKLDGLRVRLVFALQSVKSGVILHLPEPESGKTAPVYGATGRQKSPFMGGGLCLRHFAGSQGLGIGPLLCVVSHNILPFCRGA